MCKYKHGGGFCLSPALFLPSVCCPEALVVGWKDVGGLRSCLKSRRFLEHLCRAFGDALGKGEKLFSRAVVRYGAEEEPQSTEAALCSLVAAVLLGFG